MSSVYAILQNCQANGTVNEVYAYCFVRSGLMWEVCGLCHLQDTQKSKAELEQALRREDRELASAASALQAHLEVSGCWLSQCCSAEQRRSFLSVVHCNTSQKGLAAEVCSLLVQTGGQWPQPLRKQPPFRVQGFS